MSLISDLFRTKMKATKDPRMSEEASADYGYPTGFLAFDYMNGTVVHVKKDNMKFKYNSLGIVDGSLVTVIGRSGCGKTTWCMQTAGNIIRPFKSSCIFFDSVEGGIVRSRAESLIKIYGEEFDERCIIRNTGVTAENFYERIKALHDIKLQKKDEIIYDTGMVDTNGERIYKMEPSVYILDSVAMLMPDKYTDEEELSGQMSVTAAAKTNTTIFKKIIPMLKTANIIVFCINHITEQVSLNPYSAPQGQLAYLKPGERLGGGRAIIYLTNLLIRLDDHSKFKPDEGYGIEGCLVDFTLCKSRTASAGSKTTLVFNYSEGFDPELSLHYFMKARKKVNGAGVGLYFGERNDLKFSQKTFKKKLRENPEFRDNFIKCCLAELQTTIYDPQVEEEENRDSFDLFHSMTNYMNDSSDKYDSITTE